MSIALRQKKGPPKVKTLIAFSSLIMLLFCVFIAYQASKAYDKAIQDGRSNAERLTNIIGDQVELTFLAVDLTLRRVVERHYFNQMFGNNLMEDIEHNLRLWVDETPQIASIIITDEKGNISIAAFKRGYQTQIQDLTIQDKLAKPGLPVQPILKNHPLFKQLEDDTTDSFAISEHKSEHHNLLLIGRKISKLDGEFGGIVIASIDPQFFTDFFQSVDSGEHRFMALFHQDASLLFAGPNSNGRNVGDTVNLITSKMFGEGTAPTNNLPITTNAETIDDSIKVFSYKKLKNIPIFLSIVIDESDFLSEWHDARVKDISFLTIFTIFGSVLSFFALTMAKQINRVEESEAAAILASQAKSEFLANMSHELRTPLNAIIGFSEMINAGYFGDLNPQQKERIHDINLCGSHLLQLISDILEFSKGEAGKLELNEEEVDLPEIMHECERIIQERAQSKRIKLVVTPAVNLPLLLGDKRKIRQILLNLLSNAIKFTPEGGQVFLMAQIERNGPVKLVVRDTGIGIPEGEIQKALSVFGQVHRNQSHEGTGLGLPLCKMFAELHGGRLALSSKVGEGTTVTVTFPPERKISKMAALVV